jgi:hypothetical protein
MQSKLLQVYYATRLREILLSVLATTLAWMLFFSFLFCQRPRSAGAVSHPLQCDVSTI